MSEGEFIPGDADGKRAGSQVFLVLGFRIKEWVEEACSPWSGGMRCHQGLFRGEGKLFSQTPPQSRGPALGLGTCWESWN